MAVGRRRLAKRPGGLARASLGPRLGGPLIWKTLATETAARRDATLCDAMRRPDGATAAGPMPALTASVCPGTRDGSAAGRRHRRTTSRLLAERRHKIPSDRKNFANARKVAALREKLGSAAKIPRGGVHKLRDHDSGGEGRRSNASRPGSTNPPAVPRSLRTVAQVQRVPPGPDATSCHTPRCVLVGGSGSAFVFI